MRSLLYLGIASFAVAAYLPSRAVVEPTSIQWEQQRSLRDAVVFPTDQLLRRRSTVQVKPGTDDVFDVVQDAGGGPVWVGHPAHVYVPSGGRIYGITVFEDMLFVAGNDPLNSSKNNSVAEHEVILRRWLRSFPENSRKRDYIIELSKIFGHEAISDRLVQGRGMAAVPRSISTDAQGLTFEFQTHSGLQLKLFLDQNWVPTRALVNGEEVVVVDDGHRAETISAADNWSPPQRFAVPSPDGMKKAILRNSPSGQLVFSPEKSIIWFGPGFEVGADRTKHCLVADHVLGAQLLPSEAVIRIYLSDEKLIAHDGESLASALKTRARTFYDAGGARTLKPTCSVALDKLFADQGVIAGKTMIALLPDLRVTSQNTVIVRIKASNGVAPGLAFSMELDGDGKVLAAKYRPTKHSKEAEILDLDAFPDTRSLSVPEDAISRTQ